MQKLNYPQYKFRISESEGRIRIFDEIRKKWVALTPEEWVRQHTIRYLIEEKKYPASLIAVETSITVNKLSRRCDVVVFNQEGHPKMIVECKAPEIKISQKTFDQIAAYNIKLKVDYLLVTNGISHYCCKIDYETSKFSFITNIPDFSTTN